MKTNSERLNPTIKEGLSNKQVKKRIEEGNYNIAIKNYQRQLKK